MKAAPDKSHFFLTRVKFLGHIIERNTITPLKSRIDAIKKSNHLRKKKKTQKINGMLNFLSKHVYKMQLYLRPLYNILRQQNNFEWTTEHQKRFEETKTLLREQLSNTIPDPDQPFCAIKINIISAIFRLFSQAELRLSTLMRERTAIKYKNLQNMNF